MKQAFIMRGPSGAGKSSWLSTELEDPEICSADEFWWKKCALQDEIATRLTNNPTRNKNDVLEEYCFDLSRLSEAHSACLTHFIQAITNNVELVVADNTFIHEWTLGPYIEVAEAFGYEITLVEFVPESVDDIKKCISRNLHQVPCDVIARMCVEFEPSHKMDVDIITVAI